MAVMAPVSGLSLAVLSRLTADLPLPEAAPPPDKQPRMPDVVVFSSAPTRVLSDLASAGLRQLAALLPLIEQAVQDESPAPLGHLAKAANAAARQIGDGHVALLAEGADRVASLLEGEASSVREAPLLPATDTKQMLRNLARQIGTETETAHDGVPSETLRTIARQLGTSDTLDLRSPAEPGASPTQRWLSEAKHVLRSTGDALDRAEEQLRPLATAEATAAPGTAPPAWILAEILAAQAQIATVYAAIGKARTAARTAYRPPPSTFSIGHLAGATKLLGTVLILATLWLIGGIWSVATGVVALGGAAIWVWRISQASRGVTLDARR